LGGERARHVSYCDGVQPDYSEAYVQLMLIVTGVLIVVGLIATFAH
jgi:hypothetical protein